MYHTHTHILIKHIYYIDKYYDRMYELQKASSIINRMQQKVIAVLREFVIFPNTIDFMATDMNYETIALTTHNSENTLFAALRRFVLGAARLVVFRLAGCLRRNGVAGCWKWQRVVGRVREVFKATV